MKLLKAPIVDDEQPARRGVYIPPHKFDDVEMCGQCRKGREAIDAVREKSPDIVFLDVQMPGIDGFEALRRPSGSDMPIIILGAAYDSLRSRLEAKALDHLLQPINDERPTKAIECAHQVRDEQLRASNAQGDDRRRSISASIRPSTSSHC